MSMQLGVRSAAQPSVQADPDRRGFAIAAWVSQLDSLARGPESGIDGLRHCRIMITVYRKSVAGSIAAHVLRRIADEIDG